MRRWMDRGNVVGMVYFGWLFSSEEDGLGRRVMKYKYAGSEGQRHECETKRMSHPCS